MFPVGFFSSLGIAAKSKYAFVCYLLLLAAWVYLAAKRHRLSSVRKSLKLIPESERAALLAREYSTFPRSGLSGEQWLRSQNRQLIFWSFLALLVATLIVTVIALDSTRPGSQNPAVSNGRTTTVVTGPATANGTGTAAVTGSNNNVTSSNGAASGKRAGK